MPQGNPKSGEFYKNCTGEMFQVLTVAKQIDNGERLVICQALSGTYASYAVPYEVFKAQADQDRYPGRQWNYTLCQPGVEKNEGGRNLEQEAAREAPSESDSVTAANKISGAPETAAERRFHQSTEGESESEDEDLSGVNQNLLAFLDADDVQEKYEILNNMSMDEIDDQLIDTMAVSLDVVIPEGPVDMRLLQLKNILKTRGQYEQKRFR